MYVVMHADEEVDSMVHGAGVVIVEMMSLATVLAVPPE